MWEVDPDTRSKLLEVQKRNGNNICIDCDAPSPQWASPKFGIFMCLSCSGVHRSLGVHVSFVRSVSMDSFKPAEIARLAEGGNIAWRRFFDDHESNALALRCFAECSISERYDCEAGVEWKERLTAKVEGREYVTGGGAASAKKSMSAGKDVRTRGKEERKIEGSSSMASPTSTTATFNSANTTSNGDTRFASPSSSTTSLSHVPSSSATASAPTTRRTQNEAYFARKGVENAQRPENLPPSQGGKYVGFGSGGELDDDGAGNGSRGKSVRGLGTDELFQQDPVATITKGLGWLGNVVGQSVQKISTSNVSNAARQTAAHLSETVIQPGARTAAESLSRFVDPDGPLSSASFNSRSNNSGSGPDAAHRDFWDRFAASADTLGDAGRMGGTAGTGSVGNAGELGRNEKGADGSDPVSRRNSISDLLASRDVGGSSFTVEYKQYIDKKDGDRDGDDDENDETDFRDVSSTNINNTAYPSTAYLPSDSASLSSSSSAATAKAPRKKGMRLTPSNNKSKPNLASSKNSKPSVSSSLSSLPANQTTSQPTLQSSSSSSTVSSSAVYPNPSLSSTMDISRSSSLNLSKKTSNTSSSIGTAAMKKGGIGGAGSTTGTGGTGGDEWENW